MKIDWLTRDIGIKVLSLTIGISFYLYVNGPLESQKRTHTYSVPLTITGQSTDIYVVSKPEDVNITLKAPFELFESLDLSSVSRQTRAWIDLTGAEPGISDYRVKFSTPAKIKDAEWESDRFVTVELEEIIDSQRRVILEWPGGFELGTAQMEPEYVTVRGPERQLQAITNVRVALKPSEVLRGETHTLPVEAIDEKGKPLNNVEIRPRTITVKLETGDSLPQKDTLISAKFSGQPRAGFRVQQVKIEPASVKVQADRARLLDLSLINTEAIDLRNLSASRTFTAKLTPPRGVQLLGTASVKVTVTIGRG